MTAIETIKMKLEVDPEAYEASFVVLRFDPRHGEDMPFLSTKSMFLEDARAWSKLNPPQQFKDGLRTRAKNLLLSTFWWTCPEHGRTAFHTHTGKCSACHKEGRRATNSKRVVARSLGSATYEDTCILHGRVLFSTARGLCLRCYNTLGQPRPRSTNPDGFYVSPEGYIKETTE